MSCGRWRAREQGGVGWSLLRVVLLLLLLLHHGDGCCVVYGGCNKVLLGRRRHGGHGVVLRQRAFVSTLDCLVFNLTATVHSLCGQMRKDGIRRANEPQRQDKTQVEAVHPLV